MREDEDFVAYPAIDWRTRLLDAPSGGLSGSLLGALLAINLGLQLLSRAIGVVALLAALIAVVAELTASAFSVCTRLRPRAAADLGG